MSDATGVGGARGPQDELPEWPDDQGSALDLAGDDPRQDVPGRGPAATDGVDRTSAAPGDDVRSVSAAPIDDIQRMSAAPIDDIQGMSYEQARDALVAVVDRLERGGTTLEESLALWERGEALAARCEAWLTGARARLEAARAGAQARSER